MKLNTIEGKQQQVSLKIYLSCSLAIESKEDKNWRN